MLSRVSVNQVDDNTCIKVYDPEKKELIAVYDNYKKAGNKLGLTPSVVQKCCTRKTRTHSPTLNKSVALRISAIKDGDKELIKHCEKHITIKPLTV